MKTLLQENYDFIFEEELLKEINEVGVLVKVKQGEVLMDIGETISAMPLLLNGAIKVLREDEDGGDLLLYFIEKGDTCAMTFSCCMGSHKSEIRAVAEMDTELIMIPIEKMELWMAKYKSWQQFIMDNYATRMSELLETVDSLAFMRMDERLLKHLQDRAKVTRDELIHTTHLEIAKDLHTSRVVISRLLKKMEIEGKIEQQRNYIKVLAL